MLTPEPAKGICIQVVFECPGLDPRETLDSKHQLGVEKLARLGIFREQESRHLIHGQVDISVREDLLLWIPLSLMCPDNLLGDGKEQQAPAKNLAHRGLSFGLQKPLAVAFNKV